jgi:ABC-type arginine transport system ATPase subunit
MKRILTGSAGIFITQMALWPHHHVVALVTEAACIGLVASGGKAERKTTS